MREVAICRVAVINEAWYEWAHHAPLAKAGGVSDEGLKILEENDLGAKNGGSELTDKQWAVVHYTDAMTRDVAVKQQVFDALRAHFSEQEIVEVTATVSCPLALLGYRRSPTATFEHMLIRHFFTGCRVQLCEQIPRGIGW